MPILSKSGFEPAFAYIFKSHIPAGIVPYIK
jgi:hypothetical protein